MQNDPGTEWTRLTRLYADKSDEELLDLATDFGNLTDTAQTVLRDELRKRKLEAPVSAPSTQPEKSGPTFGRWNQAVAEHNREFDSSTADSAEAMTRILPSNTPGRLCYASARNVKKRGRWRKCCGEPVSTAGLTGRDRRILSM